jgi:hypothetical protein
VDCLDGQRELLNRFPHLLRSTSIDEHLVTVEFQLRKNTIVLTPTTDASRTEVLINDNPLSNAVSIPPHEIFSLKLGSRLLLFQVNPPNNWPPEFSHDHWQVFNTATGEILGKYSPYDILATATTQAWDTARCAACPIGISTGFLLSSISDVLSSPPPATNSTGWDALSTTDATRGRFFCPACWLHFDAGDALSVAAHETLRGDPVLGDDAMLRFHPTRFNDLGQAVDPMGLPATELACPHCRRQLPPSYLELPHKIFSLIGAPSSGKSYFLAVLTRILQERLFQDFRIIFKDGDPTGNMLLNQMRTKLFSASTPEECVLGKTAMEGSTYERLPRLGKWVSLPRPFVYVLNGSTENNATTAAVIFYDNAGEHFEPGHNIEDSPGALHVVSSSGIFFLYDPTSNPRFRRELADVPDPQLRQHGRADQQDSILAEMEVRMKRMLALSPQEKITPPVAILVGKCDVWTKLLDARTLPRPVHNGTLDTDVIDANSAQIRNLLERLCPCIVAQAESLANDVRYFAVSSLGHSPAPIETGPNAGLLAPDPERIDPIGVEIPAYWLLSRTMPGLISLKESPGK